MTDSSKTKMLEELDGLQAQIEAVFAAHAIMYEGVKKIAEDILTPLLRREDDDLTEHEKMLVSIARRLADLLSESASEIERLAKHE